MKAASIALLCVTFATFLNSSGYILFKLAHIKSEKRQCKHYFTCEFLIGFTLMIVAATINVGKINYKYLNFILTVSLSYADMITLSSTSSLTMMFNSILAIYILGEIFTRYDLFSILFISSGASLCMIFSNFKNFTLTFDVNH